MTAEEAIMSYAISLMTSEVIPGMKPLTPSELYKCDILYLIKLIRFSRSEKMNYWKQEEAFVDLIGI